MQDNKDFLTEYKGITHYLQHNLSWYEYENLYKLLRFNSKIVLTRLIRGSSITFWEFRNLVELFKMLENPVLPSAFIERFELKHRLSALELEALDSIVDGFIPVIEED